MAHFRRFIYRLSVAPISSSVKQRGEDIAELITHFLNLLARDFEQYT